jgi:hypothetical protein
LLQCGQGPREALHDPSVQLVQPLEDLVEGKLVGGIHGARYRELVDLIPTVSYPTGLLTDNSIQGAGYKTSGEREKS